jgi:NAD(P)H dehydrogenase (quinone)
MIRSAYLPYRRDCRTSLELPAQDDSFLGMQDIDMETYAITGITGKVGGVLARALLAAGQPVRAVVRDSKKGQAWAELGCEIAVAEMEDAEALTTAFRGAAGVFILPPPVFDPEPGFPEARAVISAVVEALTAARPARVVCLSTVGAQAAATNLLSQRTLMEEALATLPCPVTILRPAWFMENVAWDIDQARTEGTISSFLQPLDRPVPMVSTQDVGRVAAQLIHQRWTGFRVVELEGPRCVTQIEIAATLAGLLGRPVQAHAVPRDTWCELFTAQGMRNPVPRMRMLDGFNEGWITFEGAPGTVTRGTVDLETALATLVRQSP